MIKVLQQALKNLLGTNEKLKSLNKIKESLNQEIEGIQKLNLNCTNEEYSNSVDMPNSRMKGMEGEKNQ